MKNKNLIAALLAEGFVETRYEGQDALFVTKRFDMEATPKFSHAADFLEGLSDPIIITLCGVLEYCVDDNMFMFTVENQGCQLDDVAVDSELGRNLLKLAGVNENAVNDIAALAKV